jgi:hypothetical protein
MLPSSDLDDPGVCRGRYIRWFSVGIDVTEELAAIRTDDIYLNRSLS